jgi:hypothetical protein
MKDPLFKADKAIKRLQAFISEENDDEYQEAYQSWIQHSEEGKKQHELYSFLLKLFKLQKLKDCFFFRPITKYFI